MRCISFSEVSCFYEYGKSAYFQNYILGIREPQNVPLLLGSIVHAYLADPTKDLQEDLNKLCQLPSSEPESTYKRIIEAIGDRVPRCEQHELGLFKEFPELGFSLYAGIDGLDEEILTEYKTGKSFWTQQRADEHEQITHYLLTLGKDIPARIISINSKNGKFVELRTHRTKAQLEAYKEKLVQFKKDMEELGWWEKKCKFEKRIQL